MSSKQNTLFEELEAKFYKEINVFPEFVCICCLRMCYNNGVVNLNFKEIEFLNDYCETNDIKIFEKIVLGESKICHKCNYHLKRGNLPAFSIFNKMYPGDIPNELACLSDFEINLISQIKPYMKIFTLKGKQKGLKGNVVHFAQSVDEVIEQLPLQLNQAGLIIVSESLEGIKRRKEFKVRPEKLIEALNWLKNNNHLYRNITILNSNQIGSIETIVQIESKNHEISFEESTENVENSYYQKTNDSNIFILKSNFHEKSTVIFGPNVGKLSIPIIVACFINSIEINPLSWNTSYFDELLINGDSFFEKKIKECENMDFNDVLQFLGNYNSLKNNIYHVAEKIQNKMSNIN